MYKKALIVTDLVINYHGRNFGKNVSKILAENILHGCERRNYQALTRKVKWGRNAAYQDAEATMYRPRRREIRENLT